MVILIPLKLLVAKLKKIKLPEGANIAAIVRDEEVIITHHDTIVQSQDHVILFLIDKTKITVVENLFQVDVTFI